MAKEKDNELKDIELDALEAASKYMENCRNHLRDVMKPAEKAAKDLENATATEKVRLQGTKEPKAPNLKPYTESIPAKNRFEIGKLIAAAKAEGRPWKIGRCNEELESQGYRYTFYTTTKKDAVAFKENINYNKRERLTLSEDVDLVPTEEPEEEPTSIELGGESDIEPEAEPEAEEINPIDVFTKYFTFSGDDETGIVSICLKEKPEDEEECACINVAVTHEEYDALQPMFTAKEDTAENEQEVPEDEENLEEAKSGKYIVLDRHTYFDDFIKVADCDTLDAAEDFVAQNCGSSFWWRIMKGDKIVKEPEEPVDEKLEDGKEVKHPHGDPRQRAIELHNKRMCKNGKCDEEKPTENQEEELRIDESAHISLDDLKLFKPWGGAKDIWELILSQDKLEDLDKALEDMYPDGLKASELNELLWFETDWVIDTLGIDPTAAAKASEDDIIDGEAEIIDAEPEGDSNEEK